MLDVEENNQTRESLIRNIAIIAHVDHGKTTLVDSMFKQSGIHQEERAMDSNDLEKERGITILAKCTSIQYESYTINIIDTPGHTDFAPEVQRVMKTADIALVLIDAQEGIKPQTRSVLAYAIANKLQLIIVINKIDKVGARITEVLDEFYEHLMTNASYENWDQIPILYGSGRIGIFDTDAKVASKHIDEYLQSKDINLRKKYNIKPLLDTIIAAPCPKPGLKVPQLLVTNINVHNFFGKLLVGKISGGNFYVGQNIVSVIITPNGNKKTETFNINKMWIFVGTELKEIDKASNGEIVAIAGSKNELTTFNCTLCDPNHIVPLEGPNIDDPIMSVTIGCNTAPTKGKSGTKLTSSMIKERLDNEATKNPGIKIVYHGEIAEVFGRGEMQLGVLIEEMRREGFELTVGSPKIITQEINKVKCQPIERVTIDTPSEHTGKLMEELNMRGGICEDLIDKDATTTLVYKIPSIGVLGLRSTMLNMTRGEGIMSKEFIEFAPVSKEVTTRINGVLIANSAGTVTEYALDGLKDRGKFFVSPGTEVYKGMIVGENNLTQDLSINIVKAKALTNFRTTSKDEFSRMPPAIVRQIDELLAYIQSDESIEVTPAGYRLRKNIL